MASNSIEVSVRIRPRTPNSSQKHYSTVEISENGKQLLLQTPKYCTVEIVSPVKTPKRSKSTSSSQSTFYRNESTSKKVKGYETPKHKRSYFPKTPSRKAKSMSSHPSYRSFNTEIEDETAVQRSKSDTFGQSSTWNLGKIQGALYDTSPATLVPKTPSRRLNRVMGSDNIFSFDNIWDDSTTQSEVFSYLEPSISNVLEGFNTSILMYGSTGSGKTFTMVGPVNKMKDPTHPECGIIPRALDLLFREISKRTDFEYSVTMTFVELYQDRFRNLLGHTNSSNSNSTSDKYLSRSNSYGAPSRSRTHNPKRSKSSSGSGSRFHSSSNHSNSGHFGYEPTDDQYQTISIVTEKNPSLPQDSVMLKGPASLYTRVQNTAHGIKLLRNGFKKRHESSTKLNSHSSRSHAILTLTITGKAIDSADGLERRGKLTLVDLAGSERCKRSGANGTVLVETKYINQSLASLGNVLNALVKQTEYKRKNKQGSDSIIVPYRSSKLTRYLSDSLGGNSHTKIIATIDCHAANHHETLFTLRYAERAKLIQNNLVQNNFWSGSSAYAQNFRTSKAIQDSLNSHKIAILDLENTIKLEKKKNQEAESRLGLLENRRYFWQEMNTMLQDSISTRDLIMTRQKSIHDWQNVATYTNQTIAYAKGLSFFGHILDEEEDSSVDGERKKNGQDNPKSVQMMFNPVKFAQYQAGLTGSVGLQNPFTSNFGSTNCAKDDNALLAQIETDKEYIENLETRIQEMKLSQKSRHDQEIETNIQQKQEIEMLKESLNQKTLNVSEIQNNYQTKVESLQQDLSTAIKNLKTLQNIQEQQAQENTLSKAKIAELQKVLVERQSDAVRYLSIDEQQKLKKRIELETAAALDININHTGSGGGGGETTKDTSFDHTDAKSRAKSKSTSTNCNQNIENSTSISHRPSLTNNHHNIRNINFFTKPNFGNSINNSSSNIKAIGEKIHVGAFDSLMIHSKPAAGISPLGNSATKENGVRLPISTPLISSPVIKSGKSNRLDSSILASLSPVVPKSGRKINNFDSEFIMPESSTPQKISAKSKKSKTLAAIQESARKLRALRGWEQDSTSPLNNTRESRRKRRKSNKQK